MKFLKQMLLSESSESKKSDENWNIFRQDVIEKLFHDFMKPRFQEEVIEELTNSAQKVVLKLCGKQFKRLIEIKPYKFQQYIKVLSFSLDEEENVIVGLVNETGHLQDSLVLRHILLKPKNDMTQRVIHENDIGTLKAFIKEHQPSILTISPKNMKMQYLKANLMKYIGEIYEQDIKPYVILSNIKIPPIFARSRISNKFLRDFSLPYKELISAARYLQSPLAETLNLWSENEEENALLKISFHPSQDFVSLKKLQSHFEIIILEMVNKCGVDINTCLKYEHLRSPLQFISGLGPRKAKYLLMNIQAKQSDVVMTRAQLGDYLKKTPIVSENCLGFIKLNEMLQVERIPNPKDYEHIWLDFTRIHPQYYFIAEKIAIDCFQDQAPSANEAVLRAIQNKKKTKEEVKQMCFDEYAHRLEQGRNEGNLMFVIEMIVQEFEFPFQDQRKEYSTKSDPEEIFYALTEENQNVMKEESLMTVKVFSIDDRQIKVLTNHGVMGVVLGPDVFDNMEYSEQEAQKKFQVGELVKAKVKKINFEQVKILFTLKPEALNDHKEYLIKNKILEKYDLARDKHFLIVKEEDFPMIHQEGKVTLNRFKNRKINQPNFKNIGLATALQFLSDKPDGRFVFRPSSKGMDFLNLTWKFFGDVIVHISIREGFKSQNETISRELYINNELFSSIEEIIESYIEPCN